MAILPPQDPDQLRAFVQRLVDNGWPIAPVVAGEKTCKAARWERRAFAADEFVKRRIKDGYSPSVGLRLRGLVMIDIDADDAATAHRLRSMAEAILGPTPMVRCGRAPRVALFYRVHQAEKFSSWSPAASPVEIRTGRNHLGVAFGVHPDTGRGYEWTDETPLDVPLASIPLVTVHKVEAFRMAVSAHFGIVEGNDTSQNRKTRPAPALRRGAGKATDGRLAILRDAVWSAVRRAKSAGRPLDPCDLEAEAWHAFTTAADLTVRKGNGRGFWTRADAARMVAYTLRPDRLAKIVPMKPASAWCLEAREAFLSLIRHDRRCSATDEAVARVMLAAVNPERDPRAVCSMSSAKIGERAGVSDKVARGARIKLTDLGYFLGTVRGHARPRKGGIGKATVVRPNPAVLADMVFTESSAEPKGVVVMFADAGRSSLGRMPQASDNANENAKPVPSKVHNSLTISSPPCFAEQTDLFGPPVPIGGDHGEFGMWMRAERLRLGLSQAALGALIGLKQPHVANIERGHDSLGQDRRRLLVEALNARGAA